MHGWLLAILLLSMPFKPEYYSTLTEPQVRWSNARCRNDASACYYDNTIHLKSWWWFIFNGQRAERALLHEMGHHLQCREMIWRNPGGWDAFEVVVRELVNTGNLNEHQKVSLETMLEWQPHELHAELPWLLDGEIPASLASWYPWFEVMDAW